jgi:hypothetical protein
VIARPHRSRVPRLPSLGYGGGSLFPVRAEREA